jgi:hypothetical protein
MRRFRCTHLDAQMIPESLIKIWLGHGKKGVTEQSYIKIMGRMDTRKTCVENVGLGFSHAPLPPNSDLQPPRKQKKMGMFPGSSTVEHSAVNKL